MNMKIPPNRTTQHSSDLPATSVNKKREPAPLSKTGQRAEKKLREELAWEKSQFTEANLKNMVDIIHMQQGRNTHQPVSGERFTNLTGAPPANIANMFGQKVQNQK